MAGFVQSLFNGSSKTAGTSLAITGSLTVTSGNLLVVAFATDDGGSAYGCTDNLGNTYTLQRTQTEASAVKAILFTAPVTAAGTLTTQTVSWTTSVTAKAARSAEFSSVGTLRLVDGVNWPAGVSGGVSSITTNTFFTNELWVGAVGREADVTFTTSGTTGTPAQTKVADGTNGTAGGAVKSNILVHLHYILIGADSSANGILGTDSGVSTYAWAAAGAIFNAPVAAAYLPPPAHYPPLLAQ